MNLLDDKELVVIFANIEDILMTSITMLSELGQSGTSQGTRNNARLTRSFAFRGP